MLTLLTKNCKTTCFAYYQQNLFTIYFADVFHLSDKGYQLQMVTGILKM